MIYLRPINKKMLKINNIWEESLNHILPNKKVIRKNKQINSKMKSLISSKRKNMMIFFKFRDKN